MKRFRMAAAIALLGTASSLFGVTAASASVSKPSASVPVVTYKVTHKFTVNHNGAREVETCEGVISLTKSKAFPGHIQGHAWVEGCAPDPAVTCAQTADMQTENIHTGVWDADGDGKTHHGCAGEVDASIRTNACSATRILLAYRIMGIFVVIDSQGQKLTWHGPGHVLKVTRIC